MTDIHEYRAEKLHDAITQEDERTMRKMVRTLLGELPPAQLKRVATKILKEYEKI